MAITISFNPEGRTPGWPSFYTFFPEKTIGMNGYFYSFKNGNLYRHNTNPLRNNYYGVQETSSISSVFNPFPTKDIKLFKTMSFESNASWAVTNLQTDLNSGSMLDTYFEQKEGEWFSYIRNNAGAVDWKLRSASGLGIAASATGPANATVVTFSEPIGNVISINDIIYIATVTGINTDEPILSGPVTAVTSNSITVDASGAGATPPTAGKMILYYKNSVAESSGARGYYMEFTMTNDDTTPVELFSVGSSLMKSYP